MAGVQDYRKGLPLYKVQLTVRQYCAGQGMGSGRRSRGTRSQGRWKVV